ncbi:UDP-N-acetylglucosamine 2-epimerase [Paucisalibacillus globulus]|uniref:UDP-N-acetylglucosamine 2-epimerase n=1 Tax=Paucisalibacillus globulus TaxID=351095 RepID=UPI0004138D75|nr:UDP-N-acetylglucosamine 2-epimerase [Paucisalibacillus globulus]
MKKICVITGTRAEYGLLKPLIKKISNDTDLELQLIATGMHLSPEFGSTHKEIEEDGFTINEKIEILVSSDTPIGISKSMGLAMISFSECFSRLTPDLIVALGDRYEIFAAVSSASVARIPVAHLHGGETTEGAFDEAFRHSVTKMSYLHFTSTEEYRNRVIQLGEHPSRVFNVGAIGVESIKTLDLLSKKELEDLIHFQFGKYTALVTFHPVTLEENTAAEQFKNILEALDDIDNLKIIFTKTNSDTGGRIINKMIDKYVAKNNHKSISFVSMGQLKYLSALQYVDVIIGNSSSGLLEAPTFHKPTVNIGERQLGRIQAESVINSNPIKEDIIKSINLALSPKVTKNLPLIENPYENGDTSEKIIMNIKEFFNNINLKKSFYNIMGTKIKDGDSI